MHTTLTTGVVKEKNLGQFSVVVTEMLNHETFLDCFSFLTFCGIYWILSHEAAYEKIKLV